jgi:hypothetical protein
MYWKIQENITNKQAKNKERVENTVRGGVKISQKHNERQKNYERGGGGQSSLNSTHQ